jgi:hypothetical protein
MAQLLGCNVLLFHYPLTLWSNWQERLRWPPLW